MRVTAADRVLRLLRRRAAAGRCARARPRHHLFECRPRLQAGRPVDAGPNANYTGEHVTGTTLMVLGADGTVGRDEFLRLLYGGRATIEVALGATLIGVTIGSTLGTLAGYLGGRVDGVIAWVTNFALAFPVLLMAIALGATVSDRYSRYTLNGLVEPGVLSLAVFLVVFIWPYLAQLQHLHPHQPRERPFVEAARMIGSGRR